MKPTQPAIPRLMALRRAPTLVGVAPPPNAPAVTWHRHGSSYRTARQYDRDARTREAVRVDFVGRRK